MRSRDESLSDADAPILNEYFDESTPGMLATRYERHAGSWFASYLRGIRIVMLDDLPLACQAMDDGTLSDPDLDALCSLDMIVSGTGMKSSGFTLLAVQISIVVDVSEVAAVVKVAAILERVGYRTLGAVGGLLVTSEAAKAATVHGVVVVRSTLWCMPETALERSGVPACRRPLTRLPLRPLGPILHFHAEFGKPVAHTIRQRPLLRRTQIRP